MAIIKPTLILSANDNQSSAVPGPFTSPINLKTSALSLDIDQAVHFTIPSVRADFDAANFEMNAPDGQILINGSDYTASAHSDGTTLDHHGALVYLLNTTVTSSKHIIAIGHTVDTDAGDDSEAGGTGGNDLEPIVNGDNNDMADKTQRLFSLRAGEWCFFPYDYTGDLYCQATGLAQSLEVWIFHRTQ